MDKNNPSTWLKYRKNLCEKCVATCCTMPIEIKAEDLVRLGFCGTQEIQENPKKVFKALLKQGWVENYREKTGLFMLVRKSNGDCIFLDESRKCKVYEKRPGVCRKFPTEMSRKINFCPYIPKST